jgi:hypothetical protein
MRHVAKFLLASVLVTGVVAAVAWSRQGHTSQKRGAAPVEGPDRTAQELVELRRELQATKALALDARKVVAASPSSAPLGAQAVTPDPVPELTMDHVRDTLDARFHSEAYDRSWGADARQRLETHVTRVLPAGSRVLTSDCRASLCRVEIGHHDVAAHQQFLQQASADPTAAWEGPTMISLQEGTGGEVVSIGYFAREGVELFTEADQAAL